MTNPNPSDHINTNDESPRDHHTCPVWVGRLLASPIRRLVENPRKIFAPYVNPGSTVVDVGSAMGFHSLDLAHLVGPDGRVICLDIQQEMLDALVRRAERKDLGAIIETRLCTQEDPNLADLHGWADLVTALNVVHETTYPKRFLRACTESLEPGGHLFISEPRGHVSEREFEDTAAVLRSFGLRRRSAPAIWRSHTAVFDK